ncbi:MAG TPA: RNA 3'-terminal phosphate cyclase, partial [Pelomicrobium sp.]|nr:RNA 3'-terminal phosphate cyclase [Pelomicrobium sp.]
ELRAEMGSQAAVDLHASDQILIYLALAGGRSAITARALSTHAATTIWLIEQFLPVRFDVSTAGALTRIACRPA